VLIEEGCRLGAWKLALTKDATRQGRWALTIVRSTVMLFKSAKRRSCAFLAHWLPAV
jgi:hypothetical protein